MEQSRSLDASAWSTPLVTITLLYGNAGNGVHILVCKQVVLSRNLLHFVEIQDNINLLTPNVNYSGRTAPLTSKVAFYIFIQQI